MFMTWVDIMKCVYPSWWIAIRITHYIKWRWNVKNVLKSNIALFFGYFIFAKRIKHGYLEKHNQYGSPKLVMDTGLHKTFDSITTLADSWGKRSNEISSHSDLLGEFRQSGRWWHKLYVGHVCLKLKQEIIEEYSRLFFVKVKWVRKW